MRVLITGCAGFIGSNLAQRCLDEGWRVDGVDDLSNGHVEFLPEQLQVTSVASSELCSDQVSTFFKHDFSVGHPLERIKDGCYDVVFHLAAVPRVSYSVEHPLETNDANVTKTLRLVEACRGNVKRLVFASSSSVYGGATELPTREDHPRDPKSPYALQKAIVEDYLKLYSDLYGLDSACLRFFNVFGPHSVAGGAYATALSAWLTAIKSGKPMRSDGDGSQSRDLCHVDNVTDACVRAAKYSDPLRGRCYNVACGDRTTNYDILQYMLKRYPGSTCVDAPWRAGDVMHTHADITRSHEDLGYVPLIKAWQGIEQTCDWFDANWNWVQYLKPGI